MSEALRGQQLPNLMGIPLFVAAAVDDALAGNRTSAKAQELRRRLNTLVDGLRTQGPGREGDQAVIDAVIDVMGPAWRPSSFWRERLREKGYPGLASW